MKKLTTLAALLVLALPLAAGHAQPAPNTPPAPREAPAGDSPSSMAAPSPEAPTPDASSMVGTAPSTGTGARRRPAPRTGTADAGTPTGPAETSSQANSSNAATGTPTSAPGNTSAGVGAPLGRDAGVGGGTEDEASGSDVLTPVAPQAADPTETSGVPLPRGPAADLPVPDAGVAAASAADAGALDAGVPAAAVPTTLDAGVPSDDTAVNAEDTATPAAPPAQPTTTVVQFPVPFATPGETTDIWAGLRELIPSIPMGGLEPSALLALLALLVLLSSFIERLRSRLLRDGWLPSLLAFAQVSVRLLGLLLALGLIIQVVPANIRWVVYFILMASGAALGWSMRDVMPDLVAGIVIVFERRIRRGIWVRAESFSGAVERVGLRSTWLRDSKGHRVAVPNRLLMQGPVVSDEEGERVQEVVVRLGGADAAEVRRALRDAVLASPWTTPGTEPQVLRDPVDPDLWQVRGKLLSASFASVFQGQLLERAEAHLAAQRQRALRPREASANDDGPTAATGAPTAKHPKLDKQDKQDKQSDKSDKTDKTDKPKTS